MVGRIVFPLALEVKGVAESQLGDAYEVAACRARRAVRWLGPKSPMAVQRMLEMTSAWHAYDRAYKRSTEAWARLEEVSNVDR